MYASDNDTFMLKADMCCVFTFCIAVLTCWFFILKIPRLGKYDNYNSLDSLKFLETKSKKEIIRSAYYNFIMKGFQNEPSSPLAFYVIRISKSLQVCCKLKSFLHLMKLLRLTCFCRFLSKTP